MDLFAVLLGSLLLVMLGILKTVVIWRRLVIGPVDATASSFVKKRACDFIEGSLRLRLLPLVHLSSKLTTVQAEFSSKDAEITIESLASRGVGLAIVELSSQFRDGWYTSSSDLGVGRR